MQRSNSDRVELCGWGRGHAPHRTILIDNEATEAYASALPAVVGEALYRGWRVTMRCADRLLKM